MAAQSKARQSDYFFELRFVLSCDFSWFPTSAMTIAERNLAVEIAANTGWYDVF